MKARRSVSGPSDGPSDGPISIAGGPIAALLAAGLLDRVRDGFGSTNVALVLAGIVVIAALAGRTAGIVTALTAAMAFNYFHTAPYRSLRIDGGRDVATVVLLALLGLVISEVGAWRRRQLAGAARLSESAHAIETAVSHAAAGATPDDVFAVVSDALTESLGVVDCRFDAVRSAGVSGVPTGVALLPRTGALVGESMHIGLNGFELPAQGIALEVSVAGQTMGHIVMLPGTHRGSSLEDRRAAIALADVYALALHRSEIVSDGRHVTAAGA